MTSYIDSSALLKRYVAEPDSAVAAELLDADPVLITSWVTAVEVRLTNRFSQWQEDYESFLQEARRVDPVPAE